MNPMISRNLYIGINVLSFHQLLTMRIGKGCALDGWNKISRIECIQ